MATLRDPDQKGIVGTLYPSALHNPKGFWPRTTNDRDVGIFSKKFKFWVIFDFFIRHGKCIFHGNIIKIKSR